MLLFALTACVPASIDVPTGSGFVVGAPELAVAVPPPGGLHRLTANVTVAPDRAALAFRWVVDGALAPYTGPEVPAYVLEPHQRWTVTVTATAGDEQVSADASVVIPEPLGGNVLLVVLDDVGVDKFNAYGVSGEPQVTPTLDRLAAEGLRFDNAYASPLCSPTRAQLLTGRHARRTGVGAIIGGGTELALPLESLTLPEALSEARAGDYRSLAFGKYHLASGKSAQGFAGPNLQGFDWYSGAIDNLVYKPDGYFDWKKVTNGVQSDSHKYITSDTVNDALEQIAVTPEPWFAQVSFHAAHFPFHVPPARLHTQGVTEESLAHELYGAMLEALDTELGRLLASLDPKVLDNTTVIVLGDNGTDGTVVRPPRQPSRDKGTVYEGGVRVPLIVTGPHVAVAGSHSKALVHAVDVFATIVDIAGVPLSRTATGTVLDVSEADAHVVDGMSLLPWLADPELPSARKTVFAETFIPIGPPPYDRDEQTLRDERYKLLRVTTDGDTEIGFFDLTTSPYDEGENLLDGEVTLDQWLAYERLTAALDQTLAALPYEGY